MDATSIARDNRLGTRSVPIVNTALAGAVGRMLGFPLAEVEAALEHLGFVGGNLAAAGRAYEEVQLIDTPFDPTPIEDVVPAPPVHAHSMLEGAGASRPAIESFIAFRGRPPAAEPLLESYGLSPE